MRNFFLHNEYNTDFSENIKCPPLTRDPNMGESPSFCLFSNGENKKNLKMSVFYDTGKTINSLKVAKKLIKKFYIGACVSMVHEDIMDLLLRDRAVIWIQPASINIQGVAKGAFSLKRKARLKLQVVGIGIEATFHVCPGEFMDGYHFLLGIDNIHGLGLAYAVKGKVKKIKWYLST